MCFPNNFTDVLRTPILQNAERLLLLKYLLKVKIAAQDKFSKGAVRKCFSKQEVSLKFRNNHRKTPVLESLFNKVADLNLNPHCNSLVCLVILTLEIIHKTIWNRSQLFSMRLLEHVTHLTEHIIYYDFSFVIEKSLSTYQVYYTILLICRFSIHFHSHFLYS